MICATLYVGGKDDLNSPSARIVVGRPVKVGTGSFECVTKFQGWKSWWAKSINCWTDRTGQPLDITSQWILALVVSAKLNQKNLINIFFEISGLLLWKYNIMINSICLYLSQINSINGYRKVFLSSMSTIVAVKTQQSHTWSIRKTKGWS